jgi:hypothetical protein
VVLELARELSRLLPKEALPESHRLPPELAPATLDQLGKQPEARLVVKAIAPFARPLLEDGEVVVLPDQTRQLVCTRSGSR